MAKVVGFLVMEYCDDYEQSLCLNHGESLPHQGILGWVAHHEKNRAFLFSDRKSANDAIRRTEHYRLAFDRSDLPEKKFCKVVAVESECKE